jgi:ribose 5-phosphate isomerase A
MDLNTTLKKQAGEAAAARITSGMIVGLGTGSTALWAVKHIAHLLQTGEISHIIGVPTSHETATLATSLNIPLKTYHPGIHIDLTIDGADEIDPQLNLIKGGGGALHMEKKVALASKCVLIIADESKRSICLGTRFNLPVQVEASQIDSLLTQLAPYGTPAPRKREGVLVLTDQGDALIDLHTGPIADARSLAAQLSRIPGVIDHGLFLDIAHEALVATPEGITRLYRS